jgi:hypothetical protein
MITTASVQCSAFSVQCLLAQLPDPQSYQSIGWLVLTLAGLIGSAGGAAFFYKTVQDIRRANDPQSVRVTNPTQKREVTFPPEFPTVEECARTHARVDKEIEDLRADITARDEASKDSRKKLHEQLTRVEADISKLTERSENQREWLGEISTKLSDVAEGLANLAGRIK